MKETEPVEIWQRGHCGILVQLGLSLVQTSNANGRKVFRVFPTYRLPAATYDLLTAFLFSNIPAYNG
jgi:hypothetical protein